MVRRCGKGQQARKGNLGLWRTRVRWDGPAKVVAVQVQRPHLQRASHRLARHAIPRVETWIVVDVIVGDPAGVHQPVQSVSGAVQDVQRATLGLRHQAVRHLCHRQPRGHAQDSGYRHHGVLIDMWQWRGSSGDAGPPQPGFTGQAATGARAKAGLTKKMQKCLDLYGARLHHCLTDFPVYWNQDWNCMKVPSSPRVFGRCSSKSCTVKITF